MSGATQPNTEPPVESPPQGTQPRRARIFQSGGSLLAHGEPLVWLTGGGLALCVVMIVGFLGLVLYQGTTTFWPSPVVSIETLSGRTIVGEVTREEAFRPAPAVFDRLPEECRAEARRDVETRDGWARRKLVRTGNFELTGEHFQWVSDFEIKPEGQARPPWAVVFERLTWGRFYGQPTAFLVDGQPTATKPADVWAEFQNHHGDVRRRWLKRRDLETHDTGKVNREVERARLALREVELDSGKDSPAWREENERFEALQKRAHERFAAIRAKIDKLNEENARYQIRVATGDGTEATLALADVVRAYPANRLTSGDKWKVYLARWGEFLGDEPREANSEGGVFPAIFGTVLMTLLMSLAVVPFGVLAALYLREYAKAGPVTSAVRISVNNLAGVPSIVFGVFGLGFFCYIWGASIDQLLFSESLPSPTFGTGGILWASLTLALLTLPVVIVATEEALAAVPRSMREGSYACGASMWQTIRRIVLPRAMPGIMTGAILAMARGAGEVAPLMLVGAVKLAPTLPIDAVFPYVHPQRSFMHLGFHIYDLGFQSQNSEAAKPMVFTTTLLLVTIIALLNVAAVWLRARLRRKFEAAQF